MRSPLPPTPLTRTLLSRIETGRLVLYSLVAGGLVGLLGSGWRYVLDWSVTQAASLIGYRPPGVAGEGGLLMAFGDAAPWGLLLLPLAAVLYAWLIPGERGDPLDQVVAGYHARGEWPGPLVQLQTLLATLVGHAAQLLVGRDSTFTALGSLSALLLGRLSRLDAVTRRTLTLASVAAALGLVLHAPLASAVLMTETLYRRFEFEFELLMPCVLASVCAAAVYGLLWGFDPLFALPGTLSVSAGQLLVSLLLAGIVTGVAWLLTQVVRVLPASLTVGWPRLLLAGGFGLLTAALALRGTPAVLGSGSGWLQLALSGFLGPEASGMAAWRWLLMALGARLAFGGGVLVSASTGGLLGVALTSLLGLNLDLPVAALVGAAAFLSVTLNAPVAAALLTVTWGGETLLPAVLAASGLAHALSGEASLVAAQVRDRGASRIHSVLISPLARPGAARAPEPDQKPAASRASADPARQLYREPLPRSWQGARAGILSLPAGLELMGVVRQGQVLLARPELPLQPGDELLLLASPAVHAGWLDTMRLPEQRQTLAETPQALR
ncbi:chloride channel protein [Deinococcus sonorensis]|uniref:Chloride channel protein n=2 Tax=Deinococcus sonorensis TaxID=309891 RepID=A0AAU7U920_9DEIO